jgi:hypothetical protein
MKSRFAYLPLWCVQRQEFRRYRLSIEPIRYVCALGVAVLTIGLTSCATGVAPGRVQVSLNPTLRPVQESVPDLSGAPQRVAALRSDNGARGDFVEGVLRFWPRSEAQLREFLTRYRGVVIDDNAISEPPPERGISLTDEQRRPTEFVVRIDLGRVDSSRLAAHADNAGWRGRIEFSSDAGRRTFAAALAARDAGYRADANFVGSGHQVVLLRSQERPVVPATVPPTFSDALQEPRYGFGGDGAQSNVTLAWQFVEAHGGQDQLPEVAIIDSGFYLTPQGQALGNDSDFPLGAIPQLNVAGPTGFPADGPARFTCTGGAPCPWHGTGSTGVAVGLMNNALGRAGTGSVVATPMLYNVNGTLAQWDEAMQHAAAWGADVISMSFGSTLNTVQITQQFQDPVTDRIQARFLNPVFIASAGNTTTNVGTTTVSPMYPCVAPHVICVGALTDNSLNIAGFSNFGSGVDIFAPHNIPVMSAPNNNNVGYAPFVFSGTSAAAPFVAGIAVMMKAINPALTSDEVSAILVDTGHPGIGPVIRAVDALAAVRRAAQGIPVVDDRLEPNDTVETARDLGSQPSSREEHLNLDAADRDFFAFTTPGPSLATIDLEYPEGLGPITINGLRREDQSAGGCLAPTFVSRIAHGDNTGFREAHHLSAGRHVFDVRAADVNAYNLTVSFAAPTVARDLYEDNDEPAKAWRVGYLNLPSFEGELYAAATLTATLDTVDPGPADIDYFLVRAVDAPTGGAFTGSNTLVVPYPGVRVYGNDSSITLAVYHSNANGTRGALVNSASSSGCGSAPATIELAANQYYFVEVSGAPGRYVLENGVQTRGIRIPWLQRDQLHGVLNPGEPVEQTFPFIRYFATTVDPAFSGLRASDSRVHLRLLDENRNVVSEGVSQPGGGELLSFAGVRAGEPYAVEASIGDGSYGQFSVVLSWMAAEPRQVSGNLVRNGDAESGRVPDTRDFAGWGPLGRLSLPRLVRYGDGDLAPSASARGPRERGQRLFAGGNAARSGLRQVIRLDQEWARAVRGGRVKARLRAYLGGRLADDDAARARVTFLDPNRRELGTLSLMPITSIDRRQETGLLPVDASGFVPAEAAFIIVDLMFTAVARGFNTAYADNVELTLADYPD